ncbi:hypothetical protein EYF80_034299 [Liparis tanakae]|uniref:Uncharacterized protein n=1 Tax=Liparis tanakae TaxID=230148 RepID=A0A4Z2GPJ2_9TELE|nr:hypothetical protein EYF80_034299 [Liparis tanakae]
MTHPAHSFEVIAVSLEVDELAVECPREGNIQSGIAGDLAGISFPFFHWVIAGGEAWGLHSRVTSLPVRAFSRVLNGLLEKLGGEAERGRARSDIK